MSSYSDYIKKVKENDTERFFGEVDKKSNKYFTFKHVVDDDNVIIVTSNIKQIKDNFVLVVGNQNVVYLKDWQVRQIHNYDEGINAYAVKLNRNYFKVYTFQKPFDDISIDGIETFDDMVIVAAEQDVENMSIAFGWMG